MPTPKSPVVMVPVLVTLGALRPIAPAVPTVTLPELKIEPVPVIDTAVPPSPAVMAPRLLIELLFAAAMPVAAAPTVMLPKFITALLSLSVMLLVVPLPTVAPDWTLTLRPFCPRPAVKPLGEAPLQITRVPLRTQSACAGPAAPNVSRPARASSHLRA